MAALAGVLLAACSDTDTAAPTETAAVTATVASGPETPPSAIETIAPATTTAGPPPTAPPTVPPTTSAPPPPPTAPPTTTVPVVEAVAYTVFDSRSGAFLASNQPDVPLPVASLMKLLVAQTAYAAGQPTKIVIAPDGLIIDPEESRIGIAPGQELPRDLLIRAMLVVSANDAARALAIDIAGGEAQFAALMNQNAAALGLGSTQAVNATGLDADGQFSTANDMTRLAAFLMNNPTFQAAAKQRQAVLNELAFPASNDLLETYPSADGVKTGHTTQAGWCIVASALRDGRRIIVTVLGAPSEEARNSAATSLLDWAFTQP